MCGGVCVVCVCLCVCIGVCVVVVCVCVCVCKWSSDSPKWVFEIQFIVHSFIHCVRVCVCANKGILPWNRLAETTDGNLKFKGMQKEK